MLGAAFKDRVVLLVFVVVLNAEAKGAVFTRRTESLCKVTRDVPNELAEMMYLANRCSQPYPI